MTTQPPSRKRLLALLGLGAVGLLAVTLWEPNDESLPAVPQSSPAEAGAVVQTSSETSGARIRWPEFSLPMVQHHNPFRDPAELAGSVIGASTEMPNPPTPNDPVGPAVEGAIAEGSVTAPPAEMLPSVEPMKEIVEIQAIFTNSEGERSALVDSEVLTIGDCYRGRYVVEIHRRELVLADRKPGELVDR